MTFSTLALVVAVGLAGPLLASVPWIRLPVVVGEIAAGVVFGPTAFDAIDPAEPTLAFLAEMGFALLMLVVATHLPLRTPAVRPALRRGALAVGVTLVLALGAGLAVARLIGPDRPVVIAVLLATSSAAVALPVLDDGDLGSPVVLVAMAWIAMADVVTVLAIPLVLPAGGVGSSLVGALVVTGLTVIAGYAGHRLVLTRPVRALRAGSLRHNWALDLRVSILALAGLAAIAVHFGTTVLVAGFAAGVMLALLGEPRRLAQQLIGVGEGFFIPLFFVALGARLDLSALAGEPRDLVLLVALAAGALGVHVAAAGLSRLPLAVGVVASAQMGVPAAVVSVGLDRGVLTPSQGAAVLGAALVTLLGCALGASWLTRPVRVP